MPEEVKKPPPTSLGVNFATAGLGGILGWIVVHPFNTLAIRVNLAMASGSGNLSLGEVFRRDGFLSLYQGLGAGITRQVFYATSRFGLFEVFRDQVAKYRTNDIWSRLAVGVASGGCAALISCPSEVCLVRISNDRSMAPEQRRNYKSILDAAIRIPREEGVRAFWRGSMPFVNRAMLVGATQVGTYDQFKESYAKMGLKGLSNVFAASMSAGLLYSLITMPFETAKNRMAFQKPDPVTKIMPYRSTMQTISAVAAVQGPLGLWKGFLPYYARCGGHTVSMFIAVEELRKYYNNWKGY